MLNEQLLYFRDAAAWGWVVAALSRCPIDGDVAWLRRYACPQHPRADRHIVTVGETRHAASVRAVRA